MQEKLHTEKALVYKTVDLKPINEFFKW